MYILDVICKIFYFGEVQEEVLNQWTGQGISLFHLMRVITRTHPSTRTISQMRVKIARLTSVYNTYCLGHCNEEKERKIKNIKLNNYLFSKFGVKTIISLAYIKQSRVSL